MQLKDRIDIFSKMSTIPGTPTTSEFDSTALLKSVTLVKAFFRLDNVFWRSKQVLYLELRYCKTALTFFSFWNNQIIIQNKQCQCYLAAWNTQPHTARRPTHLLQEFSWKVFNHPPYSLDLASSDFHLFLHLKKFLPSQHIFRMTERWVSHNGSNPRRQTSTTQGYKSWSHSMTNVSIPEVNEYIEK